ncbi:MAG: aminotransferase class III-fold pyridoxal phosphate-dependent enzyme [Acidobacteriota bacterium]
MGQRLDELIARAETVPILRSGAARSLVAHKAEGSRVFDVDNAGYIDYLGAGGATIVGFANQFILDAVRKVLQTGIPEGFHVAQEVDLAETLGQFLPWVRSWWFCRNQDEAVRHVMRWARRTTGKKQFLVLDGGARLRIGAPADLADERSNTIRPVPGWEVERIVAALTAGGSKVAALIIDPLMTRFGVIPPPDGALEEISATCRERGVLLILDERVSGFRVHRGGYAARAGITPDVAVYGAALGGGFPLGAVAFREERLEPELEGDEMLPTPHPVSLAAADALLSILKNDSVYERLEERTEQLVDGLLGLAERFSRPMTINRVGSVFAPYMSEEIVRDQKGLEESDGDAYRRLVGGLLAEGILLPQEPGKAAFLSSAHGAKDVEETLAACERVLLRLHQEDLP